MDRRRGARSCRHRPAASTTPSGSDANAQDLTVTVTSIDCDDPDVVDGTGAAIEATFEWCVVAVEFDNDGEHEVWLDVEDIEVTTSTNPMPANRTGTVLGGYRLNAAIPAGESITAEVAIDAPAGVVPLTFAVNPSVGEAVTVELS